MIYIFYILFYPASSTFSIVRGFSLFDERDILMAWMNDVSFKFGSKSILNHPIVTFREGTARSRRWYNFLGGKDLWCWKVNICGEWELYKSFFSLFSYLRTHSGKCLTMLVSFFLLKNSASKQRNSLPLHILLLDKEMRILLPFHRASFFDGFRTLRDNFPSLTFWLFEIK